MNKQELANVIWDIKEIIRNLYDDAEVRDMAEFHAWIEQHFTITDRYTVQHGTASLQVLVVG